MKQLKQAGGCEILSESLFMLTQIMERIMIC